MKETRVGFAKALYDKGVEFALASSADAIAVYDDLIARFGSATEPALRELVAKALINKGGALSALDRGEDAIATYSDLITASAPRPSRHCAS